MRRYGSRALAIDGLGARPHFRSVWHTCARSRAIRWLEGVDEVEDVKTRNDVRILKTMRRPMLRSLATLAALAILPLTSRAQVFHGRVLDQESQQPVLVAAVLLVDYFYVVRGVGMTDSVGRYELLAPGPGRYKVRADARGYRTVYSGEFIVQAGDTVEVDLLVSYDPGGRDASDTQGRPLAPGRVPPAAPPADSLPETCDGKWAIEVANRFDQTVKVYDGSGGEARFLGDVPSLRVRTFRPEGFARPLVSLGPHEDWHPQGFRERSQGLIDVRVYCER